MGQDSDIRCYFRHMGGSKGQRLLEMRAHINLQDISLRVPKGMTTLRKLPMPGNFHQLISTTHGKVETL